MAKRNIRAAGIVIRDTKVLLMHRTNEGKEFWVFPGGGVEKGETVKEAVIREIGEETSLKVKILKLLYMHTYSNIGHKHYYYLCKYLSGTPALGNFNEVESMMTENQSYKPMWIDVKKLPVILLYPLEIRNWLIKDFNSDFNNTPKSRTLETSQLRQSL